MLQNNNGLTTCMFMVIGNSILFVSDHITELCIDNTEPSTYMYSLFTDYNQIYLQYAYRISIYECIIWKQHCIARGAPRPRSTGRHSQFKWLPQTIT